MFTHTYICSSQNIVEGHFHCNIQVEIFTAISVINKNSEDQNAQNVILKEVFAKCRL